MARTTALLVGFTAAIGQIVLMREVMVLFSGNELSLGIVLAVWLAWTAAGSGLAGWLTRKSSDVRLAAGVMECLWGFSLPLTVVALRQARIYWQTVPGELLSPVRVALICAVCLSVFCALSGALFAAAARMVRHEYGGAPGFAGSSAYLLETAGSAFGGILASILLLRFLGCVQIGAAIAVLCAAAGLSLFFPSKRSKTGVLPAAAAAGVLLLAMVASRVETSTLEHAWPGFHLVGSVDSIYGRLTVIGAGAMRSIYDNGSILANVPDPAAAEESVHYALLEHRAPRRVLLMGGGVNGSIAEALKHPTIERLDYVELDPALIALYRQNFPREAASAFSDPRVHIHQTDGRLYLQTSRDRFDVVAINVPDPSNAQLNRFYTAEFFRAVRDHLAPGGLLALQLRSSEDYIGPELGAYLRCMERTLRAVFPHTAIVPGESLHIFAAADPAVLTEDPQVLIARLKSRSLHTQYVREYFIPFRMMPDRMEQMRALLEAGADTPVNRDFHPGAYYFHAVLWSAQFGRGYVRLLEAVEHIHFSKVVVWTAAVSGGLVLLIAFAPGRRMRARASAGWCIAATGYTLMSLQILLLLTFQAVFGFVYRELALLMGMFMAGIAAGTWLGIRFTRSRERGLMGGLAINQFLVAASGPLLLAVAWLLAQSLHAGSVISAARVAFPILALFCGVPGGFQFPVASAIYPGAREANKSLTTLYAVDLMGGCVGALLLAGFLVPVFGFWNVAWLGSAVSLPPAILAARTCFEHDGYFAVAS